MSYDALMDAHQGALNQDALQDKFDSRRRSHLQSD